MEEIAHIRLLPDECGSFASDLVRMLAWIGDLQDVKPTEASPVCACGALRDDTAAAPISPEAVLGNAARTDDGRFVTSRAVEE